MNRTTIGRVAVVASTLALLVSVAPTAQAADPVNPYTAVATTTETGIESGEESATAPAKDNGGGNKVTAKIGTCSGSWRSIYRTQYANNTYGVHLVHVKESTTFYYSGGRVTCSYSTKSAVVDSYGAQGNWEFKGWNDYGEIFYAYNGHTNGGVKSWAEGWFKGCNNYAGVQLCSTATIAARTYGHYDGTYSTGGYTG